VENQHVTKCYPKDECRTKSHLMKTDKFFKYVKMFKYLGTTITNQNFIHKKIKTIIYSGNVCYHLIQNPLRSCLLCKNLKTKMHKTVIVSECDTWFLTLWEEQRLSVLESNVPRRISHLRRKK
jgi:hypothetical protein